MNEMIHAMGERIKELEAALVALIENPEHFQRDGECTYCGRGFIAEETDRDGKVGWIEFHEDDCEIMIAVWLL